MIYVVIFGVSFLFGILISILCSVVLTRYQAPIERTVKQINAKTTRKGVLIEPDDQEFEAWKESLPDK